MAFDYLRFYRHRRSRHDYSRRFQCAPSRAQRNSLAKSHFIVERKVTPMVHCYCFPVLQPFPTVGPITIERSIVLAGGCPRGVGPLLHICASVSIRSPSRWTVRTGPLGN